MIWPIVKFVVRKFVAPAACLLAVVATAAQWSSTIRSLLSDVGTVTSFSDPVFDSYGLFLLGIVLVVALGGCGLLVARMLETRKLEKTLVPRLERVRNELNAFMAAHGRRPTLGDGYDPNAGALKGDAEIVLLAGDRPITLDGKRALAAPRRPLRGPLGPQTLVLLEDGSIVKRRGVLRVGLFYESIAESVRDSFRLADLSSLGRLFLGAPLCSFLFVFFLTAFLPDDGSFMWKGSKLAAGAIVAITAYFWLEGAIDLVVNLARGRRPPMLTIVATIVSYALSVASFVLAMMTLQTFVK